MQKGVAAIALGEVQRFSGIFIAFVAAFLLCRCYEWALITFQHGLKLLDLSYVTFGLWRDLAVSFIAALPLWLISGLLKSKFPERAMKSVTWGIFLLATGNLLLITYFSATLVPLGPEFWAYSTTEMTNTIIASERIELWSILPFLILTVVLYWSIRITLQRATKFSNNIGIAVSSAGLITVISLIWISSSFSHTTSSYQTNKFAYFVTSSFKATSLFDKIPATKDVQGYPFLHNASKKDVLGPFFKNTSRPPNIVFLIVESLGGEFAGNNSQWNGFAPYLDSLAKESLYWPNGLSLSGRTFGVMPSLLGSLPPVKRGFMDQGPNYPSHQTLISLLNNNGYHTSFYSGYDTYFDKLDYFLKYQQIDFILNKQTIEKRYGSVTSSDQNYWGYPDKDMFNVVSGILDTTDTSSPRLEIYHTLQSHSPFDVPDPEKYRQKFNKRLNTLNLSADRKEAYVQYRDELTTLLYTDDAIQNFMQTYRAREEFENTIFIITGDHWLIPVPQTSQISRYHVPIIIYSPLLKQSARFQAINTHAIIAPTISTFLEQNYSLDIPDSVHWVGSQMDTARTFRNIHSIPMMKNKNQLTDYIHKDFYLSDGSLYQLEDHLRLKSVQNDSIRNRLSKKLYHFKSIGRYAVAQDKLFPGSVSSNRHVKNTFIARYDTLFQRIDSAGLSADEQFQLARRQAFEGNYSLARAVSKRLLMRYPDYHDVRLLLGRTYAWEGQYKQARTIFKEVQKQDPTYYDTYNALLDVERWAGNLPKALDIINKGLEYHPDKKQFLEKKIQVLAELNRNSEALELYRQFQRQYPESDKLQTLKQYIPK